MMIKKMGAGKPRRPMAVWLILALVAVLAFAGHQRTVNAVGQDPAGAEQVGTTPTAVPESDATAGQPRLDFQVGRIAGKFTPLDAVPEGAEVVTVGVYINNVYDLSVASNTYFMSGYLWLRWNGDSDPVSSLEFANAVESWGLTAEPLLEEPKVLPDGSNYQVLHFQGRFYQPFDLRNYPLDKQSLLLYLENSTDTADKVVYVPDTSSTGFDASLLVPGWDVKELNGRSYVHNYGTDFGETGITAASEYSTLKFSLELERLSNMFVWKLLLPLLVVLLTNWLALLLNPTWVEVRTAMPATALLTLVFLQQASLDAIPQVSTLVLMDKFYVLAYICVVVTLAQIIWINYNIKVDDPASVERMKRIDVFSLLTQVVLFAIAFGYLLFTTFAANTVATPY